MVGRGTALAALAVAPILLSSCAHRPRSGADATPLPPDDATVRVEYVVSNRPDAVDERALSGAVIDGERVLTVLSPAREASETSVVTSSGRRCPVTGVAGYSQQDNLVLLVVDWGSAEPRRYDRLRELPAAGSPIQVVPASPSAKAKRFQSAVRPLAPSEPNIEIPCENPMERAWAGSPVVDDSGKLVGVVRGFAVGVKVQATPVPVLPASVLSVSRPEPTSAMVPGPAIAWERWRTDVIPRCEQAKKIVEQERRAARAGQFDKAIEFGRRAVELDDRNGEAWYWLAAAIQHADEEADSLDAWTHAVALMPLSAPAWSGKAHALYRRGDLKECLGAISRARELEPSEPQYLAEHALALEVNGRPEEAVKEYRECLPRLKGEQEAWVRERLSSLEGKAPMLDDH